MTGDKRALGRSTIALSHVIQIPGPFPPLQRFARIVYALRALHNLDCFLSAPKRTCPLSWAKSWSLWLDDARTSMVICEANSVSHSLRISLGRAYDNSKIRKSLRSGFGKPRIVRLGIIHQSI